jgi:hypothetical protein
MLSQLTRMYGGQCSQGNGPVVPTPTISVSLRHPKNHLPRIHADKRGSEKGLSNALSELLYLPWLLIRVHPRESAAKSSARPKAAV